MRWGRGQGWRARALLIVCVAVGVAPSFAGADDWKDFVPRPFENGAFLDTYTSYERDHVHDGTGSTRWSDTFVREKLTFFSNGYSYDPRFMVYRFSIAGAARQEDYESNSLASSGWNYGSGLEYDTTLLFLPERTYNLELFARRYEPLLKEHSATQHSTIEDSRGASFRYRDKPYFLHVWYIDYSIESGDASSDVQRFNLEGEYFKRFVSGNELSVAGGFNPSWFSNSAGLDGSSMEYLFNNLLNLDQVPDWWALPGRLTSSVTKNSFNQESSASGRFENDQLVWYERLTVTPPKWLLDAAGDAPLNFRSNVYYRYQNNNGTTSGPTPSNFNPATEIVGNVVGPSSVPNNTLSNTSNDWQVDLIHRLYEGLDTTYTFLDSTRTSPGGKSTLQSNSVFLNYSKSIPGGRVLIGGDFGRGNTTNQGETDIPNELHPGISVPNLPGSFVLSQQNVMPGSITVYLLCTEDHPCPPPLVTGQVVFLVENLNYTILPISAGNTFEIRLLFLPPPFSGAGPYDFLVSYAIAGDFKLRTDTYGSSISVELFNNLLTPYFNYDAIRSDVLSGTPPGVPLDTTTYTTGLIVRYGGLQVRGEYQDLQWDVSPYQAWRAEVQYVSALTETTSMYATGSYLNKFYPNGTSTTTPSSAAAFTQETESASGSVQKQLFDKDLYLSAGGSYTRVQGQIDTNAYSASMSLMWRIGKVDLTVGANAYQTDSSGTTATSSITRDHEFVYLKLRRRLF